MVSPDKIRSQLERLRLNTNTGRPLGGDSFLKKLESFLGRRVRPRPLGGTRFLERLEKMLSRVLLRNKPGRKPKKKPK